jgi:hypothetical protein
LQIICCREFKKRRHHSKFKQSISGSLIFSSFNGYKVSLPLSESLILNTDEFSKLPPVLPGVGFSQDYSKRLAFCDVVPDKIKLSLYRSGEVPEAPECWGSDYI